jgi:catechol 2,3-dioxygenase-like lactoylglutathione lyase family enzyme
VLRDSPLVAFVATTELERARTFYESVLGLDVVHADGFACVVDAHGTTLRVTAVPERAPAAYTVLGWEVADLESEVDALVARGVGFSRFEGMDQDGRGIWTAPDGTRVAWFADPDGNTLSLSEAPVGG